jgi:RNA polymerase sigma-70 factor (ECF subfamily)
MDGRDQDAELLEGIRRDDPEAFERFVRRYGDRVFGIGLHVCGEREDAHDVLQETLLQAYRSLKTLKEPRALRSWLYRVVSNACLMKRRKRSGEPDRQLSLDDLMPRGHDDAAIRIPDPSELPDRKIERDQVQRVVRDAIGTLAPDYRMVLVLRDLEQLSTRETAEALELPESTVKMRLHRARLAVRKVLGDAVREGRLAEGTA